MPAILLARDDAHIPADAMLVMHDIIADIELHVILQDGRFLELAMITDKLLLLGEQFPPSVDDDVLKQALEPFRKWQIADIDARPRPVSRILHIRDLLIVQRFDDSAGIVFLHA